MDTVGVLKVETPTSPLKSSCPAGVVDTELSSPTDRGSCPVICVDTIGIAEIEVEVFFSRDRVSFPV